MLKVLMFTDRVGSTAHTAAMVDPEIASVSREYHALTSQAIGQYRGRIIDRAGDGVFAEFASPRDAVRCAAVIQERVAQRNATLGEPGRLLSFELRVGIDLGDLVQMPGGEVRGDEANRASRVCSRCPAGQVYLTDTVKGQLHVREAQTEKVGAFPLKGFDKKATIWRLMNWTGEWEPVANPFTWRAGITRAEDFFNREAEQKTLSAYLRGGQNCQIVGERRIGKTSLLRQVERVASQWVAGAVVAYMDLQDARCFTLAGWLADAARRFGWPSPPADLAAFAGSAERMRDGGATPVLCLDEFEEFARRRDQFTRDFFLTLRSCGQQGMPILTASQRPLSELTEPGDPSSPFYNIFAVVRLRRFSEAEASDFVTLRRPGMTRFTAEERGAILEFAGGHPLALQTACFHVLAAKENSETVAAAIRKADEDMRAQMPAWRGQTA